MEIRREKGKGQRKAEKDALWRREGGEREKERERGGRERERERERERGGGGEEKIALVFSGRS